MTRKAFQSDYKRKILSEISSLNMKLIILEINPGDPEAREDQRFQDKAKGAL